MIAAVVLLVVAMASSGLLGAKAADKAPEALIVVGNMPTGTGVNAGTVSPMWVDSARHEGIMQVSIDRFQAYDLANAKPIGGLVPFPGNLGWITNSNVGTGSLAAIDEKHSRMFWPYPPTKNVPDPSGSCAEPLFVLNLVDNSWTKKDVPCYDLQGLGAAGVSAANSGFAIDGASYYEPTNKLYVTGEASTDPALSGAGPFVPHEPTIVRELDAETLAVGWTFDATPFCDWHRIAGTGSSDVNGVISRVGDHVVVYCHKGSSHAGAGEIIDIPLEKNAQGQYQPNTAAVRSLTSVGVKGVTVDPVTGRILLIAAGAPYGPAVWIYDAVGQRFLGVVPTGVAGAFLAGFDASTGRLYLHDSRGFVVVDARHDPIPGGVRYDTLAEPLADNASNDPVMAVDPATHRLFPADFSHLDKFGNVTQFHVVEDGIPPIIDVCAGKPKPCPDPDQGTEDIPEVPGQTGRTFSSGANAFGVHLLNTGGIPNDIKNLPGDTRANGDVGTYDCYLRDNGAPLPCFTGAVASGDREGFLAQTSLAQGSALGSTGFASAGRVGPNDHATDADVREAGNCEADRLGALIGDNPAGQGVQGGIQTLCQSDSLPAPIKDALADMRLGTKRKDGTEFPVDGSLCVDFGATPAEHEAHQPSTQMGYSKVHCDASKPETTTDAEFAAVGQPQVPNPTTMAIAHSTSHAESELTDEGVITKASALAEGINIGGQITIGSITTSAVTKAHGRTGTAYAHVDRTISDVHGPGIDCVAACDAKKVANTINQLFAPNIQAVASDPTEVHTPKGFTGSVGKDPSRQAADSLINDDDTLTFDGLDILVVNDQAYPQQPGDRHTGAKSRVLVGLAGVQAESHYGIFKLPPPSSGGGGGGTDATAATPGTPDIPATPGQDVFTPGTPASVQHDAGTLGFHLAGSVGTPPHHKKRPGLVAQLLHGLRHPLEGLKNFWALIINHPAEAVMVFLMLAMLGTPVYLALRRREMRRALLSEA